MCAFDMFVRFFKVKGSTKSVKGNSLVKLFLLFKSYNSQKLLSYDCGLQSLYMR